MIYINGTEGHVDRLQSELERLFPDAGIALYYRDDIDTLDISSEYYSTLSLSEMPGQCGVLIASGLPNTSNVPYTEIVEVIAAIYGYRSVMISHREGNSTLNRWLEQGYTVVWTNYNYHSGSFIQVAMKDIGEELIDKYSYIANILDEYYDEYD